jgi:hypothetical protein
MAETLAAGELTRKARMILRLLGGPDARLVEDGSGNWAVDSGKSRRRMGQRVEDALVRELVGRDWLIREPTGSYRISVAGERLLAEASASTDERFADFTVAQLSPRVTLSWDSCVAPGSHGRSGRRPDSLEVNETALAAKQRFMRALDAAGPELSGILVDVCCLSRGLEAAERSLGWPQRSGKLVLQIALTQLARHYGLLRAEPDSQRPANIRHWGVDDYRPRVGVMAGDMAGAGDGNGDQA